MNVSRQVFQNICRCRYGAPLIIQSLPHMGGFQSLENCPEDCSYCTGATKMDPTGMFQKGKPETEQTTKQPIYPIP